MRIPFRLRLNMWYLHGSLVDKHAVKLDQGVVGAARLIEDDRGDTTADTIRAICEHGTLDGCHRFAEIFLLQKSSFQSVH